MSTNEAMKVLWEAVEKAAFKVGFAAIAMALVFWATIGQGLAQSIVWLMALGAAAIFGKLGDLLDSQIDSNRARAEGIKNAKHEVELRKIEEQKQKMKLDDLSNEIKILEDKKAPKEEISEINRKLDQLLASKEDKLDLNQEVKEKVIEKKKIP